MREKLEQQPQQHFNNVSSIQDQLVNRCVDRCVWNIIMRAFRYQISNKRTEKKSDNLINEIETKQNNKKQKEKK